MRPRASSGWSHSKVTPTTSSPAPIAKRISVVEGSRETMRTRPSLGWRRGATTETVLLLMLAALAAGFVDAVVGGGGLIQLPALLLGLPGASVVQIAATNKLASFCGTSISAATYYRRVRPDPRTFLPLMLAAFAGSLRRGVRGLDAAPQRLRPDHPGGARRRRRLRLVQAVGRHADRAAVQRRDRTSPRSPSPVSRSASTTARSDPAPGRSSSSRSSGCSATTSSRPRPRPSSPTGPPTWPRSSSSSRWAR